MESLEMQALARAIVQENLAVQANGTWSVAFTSTAASPGPGWEPFAFQPPVAAVGATPAVAARFLWRRFTPAP